MELVLKDNIKYKFNNLQAAITLAVIAIIAYWPISFYVFSLKNDALNYFLPVRHQVSEAICNGYFPFWSPYFNLGYALHGDSQSGVWNPFVWVFSITGPYTLYKLQLETILYIYLSGLGMFVLCRYFKLSSLAAMLAATSYMLCGFISDSAQFLNWISGAAFLPFLVFAYLKLLSSNTLRDALITGLFLWLMLVCAYPAEFITTVYLLLVIFIWHITGNGWKQSFDLFKRSFVTQIIVGVTFILLSLPAIISYIQYLPLSQRGTGASLEDALSNPLHPTLLLSYLTPLFVWNNPAVEITDGLERNSFFGLITIILFFSSFFIKTDNRWVKFCKWGFVISVIFSLGEIAGLRTICYYVLPLMNSFRHPAMAKIFSIFFAVQLAAFYFQSLLQNNSKKVADYSLVITSVLLFTLLITSLLKDAKLLTIVHSSSSDNSAHDITNALKQLKESLNSNVLMQLNILLQLPFLLGCYFFMVKSFQPNKLLMLTITNCLIHVMIFNFFTVVKKDRASYIQTVVNNNSVDGYPIPDMNKSIATNSKNGMDAFDEIGPLNMYNKKIGRVDYRISPCNLLSQITYWDTATIKNHINNYPLLYCADSAILLNQPTLQPNLPINKQYAFSENKNLVETINKHQGENNNTEISIKHFSPNKFGFHINTNSKQYFVLLQNHYPNWKIIIDNNIAIEPDKVNITFMGFALEKGEHEVEFFYHSIAITTSIIISLITLLATIFYLVFIKKPLSIKNGLK